MINNANRYGNFTSSQIYRLMGAPGPIKTYVAQKNLERRLNKSIEKEAYSQAIAWGNFAEQRVFDLLGPEWQLVSDQTDLHPTINFWAGSKDLHVEGVKIGDIKCFELENFAAFTDVLLAKDVTMFKKEFPKEYYQLVSNAIIARVNRAEAISYCPYESELKEIAEMAYNYPGADEWKYKFIYERTNTVPHILDGGFYQNINRFEFEIPEADKVEMTERVLKAGKDLVPFFKHEAVTA